MTTQHDNDDGRARAQRRDPARDRRRAAEDDADAARARIRANLIARHGSIEVARGASPLRRDRPRPRGDRGRRADRHARRRRRWRRPRRRRSAHRAHARRRLVVGRRARRASHGARRPRACASRAPRCSTSCPARARSSSRPRAAGSRCSARGSSSTRSRARTTTAVVRGQVKLATSHGDVLLHAGEQGVAEPGRPPSRGPAPRLSHLVSWAAQARKRDEHDASPLRNGTLFARDPGVRGDGQTGPEYPLPMTQLGVDIVVEDQVARVALDQTFHNAQDQVLEGVYRFAIPPDAALQRLAMYVDGKLTESAVVERMRARRIYEELVYRRIDPALLEWAGTGRLSLRVYPLPARQDKRLMLAYTQSLPRLYSDWSLSVPLPEIDQPVGEVAFDVTVRGCANCEITSTSHRITVDRKGEDAIVTYRGRSEQIGDSLVLRVRDARQEVRVAAHADGGDAYLMVRAPAELARTARAYRPRTWVILDDVSASRSAMERKAQADLIDAFVRELDEEDRLAVIAFDVTARPKLAPTRVLDIDRTALRASLADEGDVGATDFGVALDGRDRGARGRGPGRRDAGLPRRRRDHDRREEPRRAARAARGQGAVRRGRRRRRPGYPDARGARRRDRWLRDDDRSRRRSRLARVRSGRGAAHRPGHRPRGPPRRCRRRAGARDRVPALAAARRRRGARARRAARRDRHPGGARADRHARRCAVAAPDRARGRRRPAPAICRGCGPSATSPRGCSRSTRPVALAPCTGARPVPERGGGAREHATRRSARRWSRSARSTSCCRAIPR